MNKQKVLNWIGGTWFIANLPFIPFAGSVVYAFIEEYFFNQRVPYAVVTF